MDNNKVTHGQVFRKIRRERGIKLKDAAKDVISDQTLRRFEMDETSVSIKVLEELWGNLGITLSDYFLEYTSAKAGQRTVYEEALKLLATNNDSAVITLLVRELKKEDISMENRMELCLVSSYISQNAIPQIIRKNGKIVFNHLVNVADKLSLEERQCLSSLMFTANPGDIPVEFVRRVLKEDLKYRPGDTIFSGEEAEVVFLTISSAIGYLSRSGYYEEAENCCKEAIRVVQTYFEQFSLSMMALALFYTSLAQIQLRQNKKEGVKLANKCIRQLDASIELYNLNRDKAKRKDYVEKFYSLNKTGIDFDF